MEQLMAWNPGDPGNDATGHLFDQWLAALQTKNAGVVLLRGGAPCDMDCVVRRMTTLDETLGRVARGPRRVPRRDAPRRADRRAVPGSR